jgi:hypothetical protein
MAARRDASIYYRPAWMRTAARSAQVVGRGLAGPFRWFNEQPTPVKLSIVGLLATLVLGYLGPEFLRRFAEVMRAMQGR